MASVVTEAVLPPLFNLTPHSPHLELVQKYKKPADARDMHRSQRQWSKALDG